MITNNIPRDFTSFPDTIYLSKAPLFKNAASNSLTNQLTIRNGFISEEVSNKITINVERKEKLYDFFISCGWVTMANHINSKEQ